MADWQLTVRQGVGAAPQDDLQTIVHVALGAVLLQGGGHFPPSRRNAWTALCRFFAGLIDAETGEPVGDTRFHEWARGCAEELGEEAEEAYVYLARTQAILDNGGTLEEPDWLRELVDRTDGGLN